jgi:hypothetical protein
LWTPRFIPVKGFVVGSGLAVLLGGADDGAADCACLPPDEHPAAITAETPARPMAATNLRFMHTPVVGNSAHHTEPELIRLRRH